MILAEVVPLPPLTAQFAPLFTVAQPPRIVVAVLAVLVSIAMLLAALKSTVPPVVRVIAPKFISPLVLPPAFVVVTLESPAATAVPLNCCVFEEFFSCSSTASARERERRVAADNIAAAAQGIEVEQQCPVRNRRCAGVGILILKRQGTAAVHSQAAAAAAENAGNCRVAAAGNRDRVATVGDVAAQSYRPAGNLADRQRLVQGDRPGERRGACPRCRRWYRRRWWRRCCCPP